MSLYVRISYNIIENQLQLGGYFFESTCATMTRVCLGPITSRLGEIYSTDNRIFFYCFYSGSTEKVTLIPLIHLYLSGAWLFPLPLHACPPLPLLSSCERWEHGVAGEGYRSSISRL